MREREERPDDLSTDIMIHDENRRSGLHFPPSLFFPICHRVCSPLLLKTHLNREWKWFPNGYHERKKMWNERKNVEWKRKRNRSSPSNFLLFSRGRKWARLTPSLFLSDSFILSAFLSVLLIPKVESHDESRKGVTCPCEYFIQFAPYSNGDSNETSVLLLPLLSSLPPLLSLLFLFLSLSLFH